jgi:hypothetical protein
MPDRINTPTDGHIGSKDSHSLGSGVDGVFCTYINFIHCFVLMESTDISIDNTANSTSIMPYHVPSQASTKVFTLLKKG